MTGKIQTMRNTTTVTSTLIETIAMSTVRGTCSRIAASSKPRTAKATLVIRKSAYAQTERPSSQPNDVVDSCPTLRR